jgi:PAS domain S-box-containing protein
MDCGWHKLCFFTGILVFSPGKLYHSMYFAIEKLKKQALESHQAKEHLENEVAIRRQAETAPRESEERFRTVLENLPGSVSVHDLEGRHLMVNEETCVVTGYTKEEILNMEVKDAAAPGFDNDLAKELWQGLKPGSSFTFDVLTKRKDGSLYDSEVHLTPIILEGQPVSSLSGTLFCGA